MSAGPSAQSQIRTSWGRVVKAGHRVAAPAFRDELPAALEAVGLPRLAIGLGRSYGDSGLNPGGGLIDMTGLDRLIAFDPQTGVLRAEAGADLWDIIEFAAPRGFFLPTTPGTRDVTLGGAIANDVHGKNHHRAGTFGRAVRRIGLIRSDRGYLETAPEQEPDLFAATVGGLGLTGVIAWADIALAPIPSTQLDQEVIPFGGVDDFFAIAAESEAGFEHTVSWIDCIATGRALGRGVFNRANWSTSGEGRALPRRALPGPPMDAPSWLLNRLSLRAFNTATHAMGRVRAGRSTVGYDSSFYPLDSVRGWNRFYGKRGFFQYQSVVPPGPARDATAEMLRVIATSGQGSFLAVLKTFGALPSPGILSFPMEGTTLALDFPNRGEGTLDLMARLDTIVAEAGGRLYPAKDGRMPRDMFQRGYPGVSRFGALTDPAMESGFWRRVK